jgi:hypothetical protein
VICCTNDGNRLFRVSAAGGEATPATTLDAAREEIGHAWPQFLPDGRHYIFLVRSKRQENTGIFLGTIDSEGRRRLIDVHAQTVYAQSHTGVGYLLFLRDSTLTGQQFDVTKLEFRGSLFLWRNMSQPASPVARLWRVPASHNGVSPTGQGAGP